MLKGKLLTRVEKTKQLELLVENSEPLYRESTFVSTKSGGL